MKIRKALTLSEDLFLGTSEVPWKKELLKLLEQTDLVIYNSDENPRPVPEQQVQWEINHMHWAKGAVFWFGNDEHEVEAVQLLELGKCLKTRDKYIFVGCNLDYTHRKDLELHCKIERPEIEIVYCIEDLAYVIMDTFYPR
jgi:hypothetical protein